MRIKTILMICLVINLLCIAIYIHKHTMSVALSYKKQHLKKDLANIYEKNDKLIMNYYDMKKPSLVKRFAEKELAMKPVLLNQIKRL